MVLSGDSQTTTAEVRTRNQMKSACGSLEMRVPAVIATGPLKLMEAIGPVRFVVTTETCWSLSAKESCLRDLEKMVCLKGAVFAT